MLVAAHAQISVAVLTAVLGAFAVYLSFAGSYDSMEIENWQPVLRQRCHVLRARYDLAGVTA